MSDGQTRAGKVNRAWERAIAALLTARTIREASEVCSVPERTLKSWLARPEFAAQFKAARQEVLDRVTTRLVHITAVAALAVLEEAMASGTLAERIRAAGMTVQWAFKGMDQADRDGKPADPLLQALYAALPRRPEGQP